MVQNSQTARIAGRAVKIGLTPIASAILSLAAVGTFFGINLVSPSGGTVGLVATSRAFVVTDTGSVVASGSAVSTLWLPSPFDANASLHGYGTGTGKSPLLMLDIVRNPTGAKFTCSQANARNSATGSTIFFRRISLTGSVVAAMSGTTFGPSQGVTCNTNDRISSSTLIRMGGTFLRSSVEN